MGISEDNLRDQVQHAAKLNNKHRGEIAEMAFMRKATSMGFGVSKPWGDSERYDFVVRSGKLLWRVQVKSVRVKVPHKSHYRLTTVGWLNLPYTAEEIDFLVAYIFAEDTWYVFPASVVQNRKAICISPKSKKSPFEQYREAWRLMESRSSQPVNDEADEAKDQNQQGGATKP